MSATPRFLRPFRTLAPSIALTCLSLPLFPRGGSWTKPAPVPTASTVMSIAVVSPNKVWGVASPRLGNDGLLVHTTDTGSTWEVVDQSSQQLNAVFFLEAQHDRVATIPPFVMPLDVLSTKVAEGEHCCDAQRCPPSMSNSKTPAPNQRTGGVLANPCDRGFGLRMGAYLVGAGCPVASRLRQAETGRASEMARTADPGNIIDVFHCKSERFESGRG